MGTTPTLSNAQSQLNPEATGITVDYFQRDDRWINRRIAPVFPTTKRRVSLMRYLAADALPTEGSRLVRASGGEGIELPTQKPSRVEFLINGGQLTSLVPRDEIDEAEDDQKAQPFTVRSIMAAGFLNLEMELRVAQYFLPVGSSRYPVTNANFPAANLVAASGNWQTYNPADAAVIGPDIKSIVAAFDLAFGTRPNFALIDDITDTFFMDKLMKERNTTIALGSFNQGGDLLPSANGMRVHGMEILVPGARSESTPADATYSPQRAWGTFPYFVVGYSPTLVGGGEWNKVGDCYLAQADYRRPGSVPFQVNQQPDPLFDKNGLTHMWWDFERTEQVVKADMVMAIGPIR